MSYDAGFMRQARQQYEADRTRRSEAFHRQKEALYQRSPRLRQIDRQLRSTMGRLVATALRQGENVQSAVAALREENLQLQAERRTLLKNMGLQEDILEESPACPLCRDTGYQEDGRVCRCLQKYYTRVQNEALSTMLDLGSQRFETFSLDWYSTDPKVGPDGKLSPRKNMESIYHICLRYANHFGQHSDNLCLFGSPGLGKTFLSACIARKVSAGGFSVVYDSSGQIFGWFESQKFGREEGDLDSAVRRILICDLLILDDLGTEMPGNFVTSTLYRIVNTRLLQKKCTILTTNLSPTELSRRYSPQIYSRIMGEYRILPFFGEDIRRLKQKH